MTKYNLTEDDFVVVLRPCKDEDDNWTGEVSAQLGACVDDSLTDLSEDEIYEMKYQTALVAASIHLMHEDETIYDRLAAIADAYMSSSASAPTVVREGNVYTLNFDTKTEGNA